MSKRLILILALAFLVGITCAAYAEVQNVKVSGDITVKGVARDDFDLTKTEHYGVKQTDDFDDKDRDMLSITRVRVDADLTDNVSATVRLLNERNWNGESGATGYANTNIGSLSFANTAAAENDIDLDLAYVTLKEFLYSPLNLTIGRQELHFGNELVVGDPDTNLYSGATSLAEGDLSARKAFDALRATLDYNPLVLDVIYAKVQEGQVNLNDDITLSGINASYALNKNTTIEGYLFNKVKGDNALPTYNVDVANINGWSGTAGLSNKALNNDKSDIVNTLGMRVVDKSLKNLTLDGQVAYQFGRYNPKWDPNARYDTLTVTNEYPNGMKMKVAQRSAWAAQLIGTYDLKDVAMISKYSPSISGSYTYLSGAERDNVVSSYKGWDPMFENQTCGHIMNAIFANTNVHKGSLSAKAKLTDDVTANLDYVSAWFARKYPEGRQAILSGYAAASVTAANSGRRFRMQDGAYIGQEIDATLTYDYTEDVQFSLLGGIFLTGNNIRDIDHDGSKEQKANATELIGSMKVTF